MIDHLKRLGVTTIELLPIHTFIDEPFLAARGLSNYWGYNTLNFFTADRRYGTLDDVARDRRAPARRRHRGDPRRRLQPHRRGRSLGPDAELPRHRQRVLLLAQATASRATTRISPAAEMRSISRIRWCVAMVVDSLRHWVEACDVDGFRFDLATTLGARAGRLRRPLAVLPGDLGRDPLLANVKLIAEPWDIGPGGYRVGAFPPEWSEWNDAFRRTLRRYWAGEGDLIGEMATRMTGSADIFEHHRRTPRASINHVTVHDGFTLADLVSYERKHNEANREGNRDGADFNLSMNCGVEGPTDDADIVATRQTASAQLPGRAAAGAGRAAHPGRRRSRQQPGRQQQRLLPGQRDRLGRLVGSRPRRART